MRQSTHCDLSRTRSNCLRFFSLDNGKKILASRKSALWGVRLYAGIVSRWFWSAYIALQTARRMEATAKCSHHVFFDNAHYVRWKCSLSTLYRKQNQEAFVLYLANRELTLHLLKISRIVCGLDQTYNRFYTQLTDMFNFPLCGVANQ